MKQQKHTLIRGEDATTVDGMSHIYKALTGNEFTAEERALAQQKLDRQGIVTDPWTNWVSHFRAEAQADELQALKSHLHRLELPNNPSLLLEGSIALVRACTVALQLDDQSVNEFLAHQGYDNASTSNFAYHATFSLGGGVYARVNVSASLRTLNLADLFETPWEEHGRVGFTDFWLSRIDGMALSPSEISEFESAIEADLRCDYSEDELTFWFDPDTHDGILKVTVQEVDGSFDEPSTTDQSGMTEQESLLWDNDPFALPKTDSSKRIVMTMVYSRMHSRGLDPESEEAKRMSDGMPVSYSVWLQSKGE